MINLNNITFAYSKKPIRKNLSLHIKEGNFVCLTDESGCGKSTLLRLINGLLKAQNGTIEINGETLQKDNEIDIRRHIGYIL